MSSDSRDVVRLADHRPPPRPGEATAGAVRVLVERAEAAESERDRLAETLRLRSAALDRVSAENERLRATVARVEELSDTWERDDAYACQRPGDCPRCVTYQGAVIRLRKVMAGESRD